MSVLARSSSSFVRGLGLSIVCAAMAVGCGYRDLPPPAVPAATPPVIENAPERPPAEGSSRVVLDVEGERAAVYRQLDVAQPAARAGDYDKRAKLIAFDRYELLCVTPCAADLRQGAHVLRFESLRDAERRSEAIVIAPRESTVVRHSLGRTEGVSGGYTAFAFTTITGSILALFSGFTILSGAALDGSPTKNGRTFDGDQAVTTGLVTLGVSAGVIAVGAIGMALTRPDRQQGSTVQFSSP